MLTSRVPSFRDISSSNQIFRSASTTSDSYGSRMKPSWPGRQAGSWPATLRTRSLQNRSDQILKARGSLDVAEDFLVLENNLITGEPNLDFEIGPLCGESVAV